MARIHTDKRSRDVDPAHVAKGVFRETFVRARSDEVDLALALLRIADTRGHVFEGKKSVHAWALELGCGPGQARRLLALGKALALAPQLAEKVRSGQVCAESAVCIGRLFGEKKLDLDAAAQAEWLERAESMDPAEFRDAVGKAIDDARQNAPTHPLTMFVTRETREGFQRTRLIMSKGLAKKLTEGEVLGHLVADWRCRNDPRVAPLPKRGRKRGTERNRHRPAREQAKVERRSGHVCEACGVAPAAVFAHVGQPYAKGGPQTAKTLAHVCPDCHFFLDRGVWVFRGWTAEGKLLLAFDPVRLEPTEDDGEASQVRERAPPYVVTPRVRSFAARRHPVPPGVTVRS